MSFTNPTGASVKMPADVFLKLDSRQQDNKMFITFKKGEGDSPEKLEVDKMFFAVLDENFMTVTGRVPGTRNKDGYLRCNVVHYGGKNKMLKVQETDGDGKVSREISYGPWKSIEKTVRANGGKNTKQVYGLLTQVSGPDTERVDAFNAELKNHDTIIKIDIKGNWWGMYLKLNKRIKVSNWEQLYVSLSLPLEPYENQGYGTFSYLPTAGGRKVSQEKDPQVYAACVELDGSRMKEYRDYICGLDKPSENSETEDPVSDFARENGISEDVIQGGTDTYIKSDLDSPDDDLPF